MQKIFNTILVLVFLGLVSLFVYKTLSNPQVVKVSVDSSSEETVNSNAGFNEEQIKNIVKDYIINNPEVIIQAVENIQKKKFEESNQQSSTYLKDNLQVIEESNEPPVLGNSSGAFKLVMFFDYNCSYCKKAHEYNQEITQHDSTIKLILRPLPILGEVSMYAAKVALAVHKISVEKFPLIHDGLMKTQSLSEATIKELLQKHEIDYALVENEINSYDIKQLVNHNFELAKNLGIKGAPSYIINGYFVPGLIDTEKFNLIMKQIKPEDSTKNTTPDVKKH